jgi:hypothetical protein
MVDWFKHDPEFASEHAGYAFNVWRYQQNYTTVAGNSKHIRDKFPLIVNVLNYMAQ